MSFFESDIKAVYSSKKVPRLRSPILICGFPGSGYVGKLAIDHIIEELESIHLADIYSTSFPPQVIIKNTGIVELMKNILYYVFCLLKQFFVEGYLYNLVSATGITQITSKHWTVEVFCYH